MITYKTSMLKIFLATVLFSFYSLFHANGTQLRNIQKTEELLNGLKVTHIPSVSRDVRLHIRIKNGAAFDMAGKEGTTYLLTQAMMPDSETLNYVRESLEGDISVSFDYEYIDLTARSRSQDFERLMEIVRSMIVPLLPEERLKKIKERAVEEAMDLERTQAEVAERAVLKRLYGPFPYSRSLKGSAEALRKISRADIMLARERLIVPNNSLLAVSSGLDHARVFRAIRQFIGPWARGEVLPKTFRQPESPPGKPLIIDSEDSRVSELRIALSGSRKTDPASVYAELLSHVALYRLNSSVELKGIKFLASHKSHALTGTFIFGASELQTTDTARVMNAVRQTLLSLGTRPVTQQEFSAARSNLISQLGRTDPLLNWITTNTYGEQLSDPLLLIANSTLADLNHLAKKLFTTPLMATVIVGDGPVLSEKIPGSELARGIIEGADQSRWAQGFYKRIATVSQPKTGPHR
jgi:predicted Zn-dependent peptidase